MIFLFVHTATDNSDEEMKEALSLSAEEARESEGNGTEAIQREQMREGEVLKMV